MSVNALRIARAELEWGGDGIEAILPLVSSDAQVAAAVRRAMPWYWRAILQPSDNRGLLAYIDTNSLPRNRALLDRAIQLESR